MNQTKETQRQPTRDLGDLWSVQEAAAWLHISGGYLYEVVRKGQIAYLAMGNKKLIPGSALLDFYASRLQQVPELEKVPANDVAAPPANDDGEEAPAAPPPTVRIPRKRGRPAKAAE